MTSLFDGPGAGVVGLIMARANAEAESEAVARLDPAPDAHVLVIGYGPGVGVGLLARRLPQGVILGVDPSEAMRRQAARRNRRLIAEGRVRLERTAADRTSAPDAAFDGAIAVNSLQLCDPLPETARELARVLKPGARLVSLTHDWAAAKTSGSAAAWVAMVTEALGAFGFTDIVAAPARAENGRAIALTARRG